MLYYYVKTYFGHVLQKNQTVVTVKILNSPTHIENNSNLRHYDREFSPLTAVGTEFSFSE